ncbi:MAG: VWA domain-containing protein [Selenomonadaceae bacterium]|nr:VWA domain-containing protein [Selenomonadaceae bacterium]
MEKINDYLRIRIEDLGNNPTTRVAICLCLDVSGSMASVEGGDFVFTGRKIVIDGKEAEIVTGGRSRLDELQDGIRLFYESIMNDKFSRSAAEICVVTFDDEAKCLVDFANVYRQEVPVLKVGGITSMGEGVNLALDLLEQRKSEFKAKGVSYHQPWLVLMTDGEPNGNETVLRQAMARTNQMINDKKLTLFPIGIGKDANLATLAKFTPKGNAIKLRGINFKDMFEWLSASVEQISQSTMGERANINPKAINNWGEKYSLKTGKTEPWPDELP